MSRILAVNKVMLSIATDAFSYGSMDCCQFAAKVAHEITGVDYSQGFKYASEQEAQSIILEYGGFEEMVSGILNKQPTSIDNLQHGDPVLVDFPHVGLLLGVFARTILLVKTTKAVVPVPVSKALKGWSLG